MTHESRKLMNLHGFVTTWSRNGCVCNAACSRVNGTLYVFPVSLI